MKQRASLLPVALNDPHCTDATTTIQLPVVIFKINTNLSTIFFQRCNGGIGNLNISNDTACTFKGYILLFSFALITYIQLVLNKSKIFFSNGRLILESSVNSLFWKGKFLFCLTVVMCIDLQNILQSIE